MKQTQAAAMYAMHDFSQCQITFLKNPCFSQNLSEA